VSKGQRAEEVVEKFLQFLEREYAITAQDLDRALALRDQKATLEQARAEARVPLGIFLPELGAFETIVKFLREGYGLPHAEIARIVGRSHSTVRVAYRRALEKVPRQLGVSDIQDAQESFPAGIIADRSLSVLEHLVTHLLSRGMRLADIARILHRDQRTIWTVKQRALGRRRSP